jgi:hypothetical protein
VVAWEPLRCPWAVMIIASLARDKRDWFGGLRRSWPKLPAVPDTGSEPAGRSMRLHGIARVSLPES